jgi:pyruvate kinase
VAGRVVRLTTPVTEGAHRAPEIAVNGDQPIIGPQDIVFSERIDRSCLNLLQRAGGLITQENGLDSLGAVVAMELGIPAVIGVEGQVDKLVDGVNVVLDAVNGEVSEWKKSSVVRST